MTAVNTLLFLQYTLLIQLFSSSFLSQVGRTDVSLNAEMSKSIPFLTRPEKLDGSMPGDMGFDPMGLSEIQGKLLCYIIT